MATLEELKERVDELLRRHASATKKKAELQGQLEAKKAELSALGEEILAAGYDPRKLREERDKAHTELEGLVLAFDRELADVEAAITAYEEK